MLTKDEIMNMAPGREMDRLIATKVMGWIPCEINWWLEPKRWNCLIEKADEWVFETEKYGVEHEGRKYQAIPSARWNPSKDISDAWEVVEKLKSKGLYMRLFHDGEYGVSFKQFPKEPAFASTAPSAICKAALLAALEGEER